MNQSTAPMLITSAGDQKTVWAPVLSKLEALKALDAQCQIFGADHHRHTAAPPLADEQLARVEARLGVVLPAELRSFYREVGDGGVGPHHGIVPSAQLVLEDGRYLFVSDQGGGHRTYLTADRGHIAFRDPDDDEGYFATGMSFAAFYNDWLDGELAAFNLVIDWIDQGWSVEKIATELAQATGRHDARDRVVSLIDVVKPVSMFGTPQARIHHGAAQLPWYEQQLAAFRQRRAEAAARPAGRKAWWRFWG
jgi:hypothetical protein